MKRDVVIQVKVTERTADALRELAREQERPLSSFCDRLFRGYIQAQFDRRMSASEVFDVLPNNTPRRLSNIRTVS